LEPSASGADITKEKHGSLMSRGGMGNRRTRRAKKSQASDAPEGDKGRRQPGENKDPLGAG